MGGSLPWIPKALSTLRPATSPRLLVIRLIFVRPDIANRSVETVIEVTGNDLRRVADEAARIEREFRGAVELTFYRDPTFKAVSDTLNVRFYFHRVDVLYNHNPVDSFSFIPADPLVLLRPLDQDLQLFPPSVSFDLTSCGAESFEQYMPSINSPRC